MTSLVAVVVPVASALFLISALFMGAYRGINRIGTVTPDPIKR